MHTTIYSSKQCKKYRELSSLIIDKVELYEWFMKRLDKLIDRFSFSFIFVNCLFLRYQLQPLKNEFCITNVLSHLLFCNRSPNSISQCRLCSHLFVENANDFISSIKHHFSLIFTDNKIFSKEIELLFIQSRRMGLNFNILFLSETPYKLVDPKHIRSMNFLVIKQPCDIIFCLKFTFEFRLINFLNFKWYCSYYGWLYDINIAWRTWFVSRLFCLIYPLLLFWWCL